MTIPIARRAGSLLAVLVVAAAGLVGVNVVTASPAYADGCYTWSRTLRNGTSGEDVRQLQIRIAGWVDYREVLSVDGNFGPRTELAVRRFQAAYGLGVDGVAGSQTFGKLYELQDDDCTPIHFTYNELAPNCGNTGDYSGGKVSTAQARANILRVMWQLEALRRKLGDSPLDVNSGFRSISCNSSSGGASNSMHLYGAAADVEQAPEPSRLCEIARQAIRSGFSGIVGPGDPNHNDHAHVDIRRAINGGTYYYAPNCSNFP
jgi:zinc D-Ala-D-Ala carboxypeptidase